MPVCFLSLYSSAGDKNSLYFFSLFACENTSRYPYRSFIFVLVILFYKSYHTSTTLDSEESIHTYIYTHTYKNPVQTMLITAKL